jgi:hypothetical protein
MVSNPKRILKVLQNEAKYYEVSDSTKHMLMFSKHHPNFLHL